VRDQRIVRDQVCCAGEGGVRSGAVLQIAAREAKELPNLRVAWGSFSGGGKDRFGGSRMAVLQRSAGSLDQGSGVAEWSALECNQSCLGRVHGHCLNRQNGCGQKQSGGLPKEPATVCFT
jgi:hypothetical protein